MYEEFTPELTVESVGSVRIIRLNRPEQFNAVNEHLHWGLANIWEAVRADREARAAVLTGSGRAFSAGGDLDWFSEIQEDRYVRERTLREARHIVNGPIELPIPVVAAVNGPATGLGCSLAVLCDLVFISDTAYFADPHVAIGLVAGDGGAVLWPALMSIIHAKEFVFTGDRISAEKAVQLGLANRVVESDDLLQTAVEYAQRLAELPPQALRATKQVMNMHLQRAVLHTLDMALVTENESFQMPEHHERVEALIARNKSKKEGR